MSTKHNYLEAIKQLHSVQDWVRWAASSLVESEVFFGHGTETAWDEAMTLVLQILHLPLQADPMILAARLTNTERQRVAEAIRQRIEQRKPLPYITKRAWLGGLEFYVDERVLIPRSPFAEWVERRFEPWVDASTVNRILEIGTGSGCLAIAAALAFPDAIIEAVDVDPEALAVAKINIEKYELEQQVNLITSNIFENISATYDIIFSNPPYVGEEEIRGLPAEYSHEPLSALQADAQGLDLVLTIIKQSAQYLTDQGVLLVEVGNSMQVLSERLPKAPFLWLEQQRGGHGIFLLTKQQLEELSV